jgi:hypothetical protein
MWLKLLDKKIKIIIKFFYKKTVLIFQTRDPSRDLEHLIWINYEIQFLINHGKIKLKKKNLIIQKDF